MHLQATFTSQKAQVIACKAKWQKLLPSDRRTPLPQRYWVELWHQRGRKESKDRPHSSLVKQFQTMHGCGVNAAATRSHTQKTLVPVSVSDTEARRGRGWERRGHPRRQPEWDTMECLGTADSAQIWTWEMENGELSQWKCVKYLLKCEPEKCPHLDGSSSTGKAPFKLMILLLFSNIP